MAKPKTKKSDSENKASAKTIEKESEEKTGSAQSASGSAKALPEKKKKTRAIKHEKKAPTTEEQLVWTPVRHPNMLTTEDPHYFVKKNGDLSSLTTTGKHRPLQSAKRYKTTPHYSLRYDGKNSRDFRLEEIMVHTFSKQVYNKEIHYIFHKDGLQANCAEDNLVVCDLTGLQDMEIARLEKLHSGTRYKVVNNLHDSLTFENYLVSETGRVYSLLKRQNIQPFKNQGYQMVTLRCDSDTGQEVNKKIAIDVDSIVALSFQIPMKDLKIGNNKKSDDPLNEAPNMLKKLPEITKETKWHPVGTLPWSGLTFSKYQVSDMGHVRKIGEPKLLTQVHSGGYISVCMEYDTQNRKDKNPATKIKSKISARVPRLVANAFVDGYSETHNYVKHLNGDKLDNHAQNLKWVSRLSLLNPKDPLQVIATLEGKPDMRKEFVSKRRAIIELSCAGIRHIKPGESTLLPVVWDGKNQLALIDVS